MVLGGVDFGNMFIALNGAQYATLEEAKKAAAPTINYGVFINTVLEFLIVAFVLFLLVRQINRLKEPAAPETPMRDCPFCVSKIPVKATKCAQCTSVV
jgi:large conductance mechanosensitive channel